MDMPRAMLSALLCMFMLSTAWSRTSSSRCVSCTRNSEGRIKRSPQARRAFEKSNPCPSTGKRSGACHGYIVDHVQPLKRGGADAPSNMQWQSDAAAKAKDRVE
jgi:hypothetical protein